MKRYRHVTGHGVSLHVSAADDVTAARDALFYAFGRPLARGETLPQSLTVDGAPFDVLWPATGPVVVPARQTAADLRREVAALFEQARALYPAYEAADGPDHPDVLALNDVCERWAAAKARLAALEGGAS